MGGRDSYSRPLQVMFYIIAGICLIFFLISFIAWAYMEINKLIWPPLDYDAVRAEIEENFQGDRERFDSLMDDLFEELRAIQAKTGQTFFDFKHDEESLHPEAHMEQLLGEETLSKLTEFCAKTKTKYVVFSFWAGHISFELDYRYRTPGEVSVSYIWDKEAYKKNWGSLPPYIASGDVTEIWDITVQDSYNWGS